MFDIGAHFGSTLLPFAHAGWQVHAFEPDPSNRERLREATRGLDNVAIVPAAVSDEPGSLSLYRSEVSTGISALAPFHESHRAEVVVDVTTISDYVARAGVERIDFLKVDTEGYDLMVLHSVPWEAVQPHTIVCEFEDAKTRPLGYAYTDLADFLIGKGYRVLVSEWFPAVEYGRVHRWRRVSEYPEPLLDDRAWGNLVAVRPELWRSARRAAAIAAARFRVRDAVESRVRRPEGNS